MSDSHTSGDATANADTAAAGTRDAVFLDVDEADVETSTSDTTRPPAAADDEQGIGHSDAEPGTDNDDVTMSRVTDALDSDAIASSGSPLADGTDSAR